MADNDTVEWRWLDSDLLTVLGIMPGMESHLYLELNEPGSGAMKLPYLTAAAAGVASGQYAEASYRGGIRGGFLVENKGKIYADSGEGAGKVVTISGRGALAILDDAIVWDAGDNESTREFSGQTRAAILITLINEAQGRGALANLAMDFDAVLDSDGIGWTDAETVKLSVGMSLLEVVRKFAKVGMEFDISHDASVFTLHAYENERGSDKSASVYLRVGVNCEEVAGQELGGEIHNVYRVKYKGGFTTVSDAASIAARRRREAILDAAYAGNSGAATTFGQAELQARKDPKYSRSVRVYDGVGPRVFLDYDLGDTVTLDVNGTEVQYRIRGLQLDWDGSKFADVVVNLNSTLFENEIQLAIDIEELKERWLAGNDANQTAVSFWAAIGEPNDAYSVTAVAIVGTKLYVGGSFTQMGGIPANNIAVYDIETGEWSALGSGLDDHCDAIVVNGTDVYAGGGFTLAGGIAANYVAKWDGAAWSALAGGVNGYVYSLALLGTDLLAAGNISNGSGWVVRRWNGASWSQLATHVMGKIYAVRVNGSDVYIGGSFETRAGGGILNNVAILNGATWDALGSGVTVGAVDLAVYAIEFMGSDVYVGGDFGDAGGTTAHNIAKWDGASWSALGDGTNGIVRALAASVTDLYVGGDFDDASGIAAKSIAKWDGGGWNQLQEGVDDPVNSWIFSLAIYNLTDVYAGGTFSEAGGHTANDIAAFLTTFESILDYLDNGVHWGEITGTLSNQTDLWTELGQKLEDAPSDGTTYGRKNAAWAAVAAGTGDISGTGVVGQVAEFVTDTKHLQAAKLIGPVANILTFTNAAAATLALNITAAKTLTLTAADNYTLTIPATGTAALLGIANVFTAAQKVNVNSTTALLVEQTGVKSNVLVVDTTNAGVAVNQLADPTHTFEVQGKALTDSPSFWTGVNLYFVPTPTPPTLALVADGGVGNLSIGQYQYTVSYMTALGETSLSTRTFITTDATHKQVTVTIPVSTDPRVTKRRIYRGPVNNNFTKSLLATINDNTTTTYNDNIADGSISGDYSTRPNTTNAAVTFNDVRAMFLDPFTTSIGYSAGLTIGGECVFLGGFAGEAASGNTQDTFVGYKAGAAQVSGSQNTAVGRYALYTMNGATRNTAIGRTALLNTTGSANTALGCDAGFSNSSGANNVFLGRSAGYRQTTASNQLFIDNQVRASAAVDLTNAIIYGVMGATPSVQTLRFNAVTTVAVDTTTNNAPLKVLDLNAYVSTAATGFANGGGVGMTWTGETATDGTSQLMAAANATWVDSTNATRKAKLSLSAYDTAARLGIEIEASGTAAKLGFFGHATALQPAAYTPTNVSADRAYDANATTLDEVADVLGTLIADLQSMGLIG